MEHIIVLLYTWTGKSCVKVSSVISKEANLLIVFSVGSGKELGGMGKWLANFASPYFYKKCAFVFYFFITSDIIIHYLQIHVNDILIRLSIFYLLHKPTIMRHFFRYEFKLFWYFFRLFNFSFVNMHKSPTFLGIDILTGF